MPRIYLSAPHMGEQELNHVHEAFRTNWLSSVGPNIDAFEQEFETRVGAPSCALGSGTAAIHLGLRLLGVGPGDVVLASTLTFVASVNPILYLGATPVFVDSEFESWNMDANVLEDAIKQILAKGTKPKAIVLVHLYGQSANLDAILSVANRYEIAVLEDAAEALGTTYKGKQVGALGALGAFSFNGNKIITTTGGGMLVSPKREWIQKAKFWSTQAKDPGVAYEHSEMGYNYRMSNVLAGIGRGQLAVLDARVAARRAIAFKYRDAFAKYEGLALMPQASWGEHTNWLSCFTVDEKKLGVSRDDLLQALTTADIESRPVWKPMHIQAMFKDAASVGGFVAESLFASGLCLPSSSFLGDDQEQVIRTVATCIESRKALQKHQVSFTASS